MNNSKLLNNIIRRISILNVVSFLITFFTLLFLFLSLFLNYLNPKSYTIEIKDKFIKNGGKSGKYLVVDSNNKTYEISDLLFLGKFNSTDIYNSIDIGKSYKIYTTGYRIHIFSLYQNINKIELLEE